MCFAEDLALWRELTTRNGFINERRNSSSDKEFTMDDPDWLYEESGSGCATNEHINTPESPISSSSAQRTEATIRRLSRTRRQQLSDDDDEDSGVSALGYRRRKRTRRNLRMDDDGNENYY